MRAVKSDMQAKDREIDSINIGDNASFERTIHETDLQQFAQLSGDYNPLHMDEVYASSTPFGQRIVHGMLLGSFCSALVGMYLPGKRCLYLRQTLSFKKPVFIGDKVTVLGKVTNKSISTKILTIAISITRMGEEMVEGEATVQVI